MAHRNRHKKKTSRPPEVRPPRKADSLRKRIHEITGKTAQARQESSQIARQSKRLEQSAHFVHRKIEATHENVHEAHQEIHAEARKERGASAKAGQPLLVVGIGASAGGFEAFSQLLENLRPDLGMAFVFVQHLDPTHKSSLSSLLSHVTLMSVTEVRDRTRLAANRVYVIPPNTALTIAKGGVASQSAEKRRPTSAREPLFRKSCQGPGEPGNRRGSFRQCLRRHRGAAADQRCRWYYVFARPGHGQVSRDAGER